ncbi:cupin domain-containing protein [Hymenobacter radiodurans]|uniref:cupin domain-containing protein n=1 Tax=Hymenobacter radiodurans TaxID=2496028 RepID=UPI0010584231|nr:cupin domain-containing protein [Hymenobacter radiodurans]
MKTALFVMGALCLGSSVLTADLTSAVYKATARTTEKGGERVPFMKGSTLDLAELEVYTFTLKVGQVNQVQPAATDAEELIVVKEGSLAATIQDSTKTLGPGGVMLIGAGDKQRLRNVSGAPATYYVLRYKSKDGIDRQRTRAGGGSFMKDWGQFTVVKTDNKETRPVFDRPSTMFRRFDVHATMLMPGIASHPPHTHRTEEIILMTQGSGEILIDRKAHKAAAGDIVFLEANVPHAFTNTGKGPCGYFAIQWHSNAEK